MSMLPKYSEIVDLLKKGATVEAQEKIMQLRETALELQEENLKLKKRLNSLKKKLQVRGEMVWAPPYYWRVDGAKKDGPFCQNCWDKEEKQIRLQESRQKGHWTCLSCEKQVTDKTYEPPAPGVVRGRSRFQGF